MKLVTDVFSFDAGVAQRLVRALDSLAGVAAEVTDVDGLAHVRVETLESGREQVDVVISSVAADVLVNRSLRFDAGDYETAQLVRIVASSEKPQLVRVTDDGRDVLAKAIVVEALCELGADSGDFDQFGGWWQLRPQAVLPRLGGATSGVVREGETGEDDGYFESLREPVRLAYDEESFFRGVFPPLMRTWERFGVGRGATPLVLASKGAFDALVGIGAPRVYFEPVLVAA